MLPRAAWSEPNPARHSFRIRREPTESRDDNSKEQASERSSCERSLRIHRRFAFSPARGAVQHFFTRCGSQRETMG
jgi:hypothetical protein